MSLHEFEHHPPGGPPPLILQRPPRPGRSVALWMLIVLLVVMVLPYTVEQVEFAITRGRERAEAEGARQQLAALPESTGIYAVVAKAIAPSVVGVETVENVQAEEEGDEWSHLFAPRQRMREEGLGSGVIVDPSGYIITNAHVVRDAVDVTVKLSDGRSFDNVQVVGADPATDIAVLKINATDLTAAPWGNSEKLEVGDPVLAIGNPYGLARTVTAGIVSAKGRRGITDAAVNPGNSGGPLVNLKGQVVGINTAILGESFRGISFAIPSNITKDVYEQLKSSGNVARGWLGVQLQPLSADLARQLGVKGRTGVVVTRVVADSPAERAGIEDGDVIVKWNGRPIDAPSDLTFAVVMAPIGSHVPLVVMRGGKPIELTVTVEQRPAMGMDRPRR